MSYDSFEMIDLALYQGQNTSFVVIIMIVIKKSKLNNNN